LDACAEILLQETDTPLLPLLWPEDGNNARLHQTRYTQLALFAFEYALARQWMALGVVPTVVMGHSVGEYVAASIAGVFSLEDGLRLIANRARLMSALPSGSGMLAVLAGENEVAALLQSIPNTIDIAAMNGPRNTVIAGTTRELDQVAGECRQRAIPVIPLQVSHAFHSRLMTPMLGEFEKVFQTIRFRPLQMEMVSNLTGQRVTIDELSFASYWCDHARNPVRFQEGSPWHVFSALGGRFDPVFGENTSHGRSSDLVA